MRKSYKGFFLPKNPRKYLGDPRNIVYRSLWERKVMVYLDENPNVLQWASEEIAIPYYDPVQQKKRRYFPDFIVTTRGLDGKIKKMMLEIKPKKETEEPKVQSRKTKRYITEVTTWATNQAKWKAAQEYCINNDMVFKLITEDHLKYTGTKEK